MRILLDERSGIINIDEYLIKIDNYTEKNNEIHLRERMKNHLRWLVETGEISKYIKSDELLLSVLAGWSR